MMRRTEIKRTEFKSAPAADPKRRKRKCAVKSCRAPFEPRSMTHKCCSPECGLAFAAAARKVLERADTRKRLDALKTRSHYLKAAQASFNRFIRERDRDLPCISCGRHHQGQNHAGHYRSVGAQPSLRFHESNCWLQCQPCNTHLSGNAVEYRLGLIKRIGSMMVGWLELEHAPKKYSIPEIQAIRALYDQKYKELKNGN